MGNQPKLHTRQIILADDDIETRAPDDGPKIHRITVFRNEKARMGPELSLKGMSTANYKRNPTVQWAHDTMGHTASGGLPIGRSLKLDKTEDRLISDFSFLQDDPFASRVENAWNQGFIRAASVSWRSIETERIDDEEQDFFGGGWRDVKSELLEWSLVPVPADPGALREAFVRSVLSDSRILTSKDLIIDRDGDDYEEWRGELKEIVREIMAENVPEEPGEEIDYAPLAEAVSQVKATLGGS